MNKLGISDDEMMQIEDTIIKQKMSILSEKFTFNMDQYNVEYLRRLHAFLFSDLYFDTTTFRSGITDKDLNDTNKLMLRINRDAIEYYNSHDEKVINRMLDKMETICDMQLFKDGNNRTLIAYFTILSSAFQLPIEFNPKNALNAKISDFSVNEKGEVDFCIDKQNVL